MTFNLNSNRFEKIQRFLFCTMTGVVGLWIYRVASKLCEVNKIKNSPFVFNRTLRRRTLVASSEQQKN